MLDGIGVLARLPPSHAHITFWARPDYYITTPSVLRPRHYLTKRGLLPDNAL